MGRGMERAREAACVVRRVQCVVRGRSLCRRAEEQLTVICVETETAALTKGVWISSQTCSLLLWWPALSATSSDFFRACDCEGNPADECCRVEPPGAVPQYHVRRWTSEPTYSFAVRVIDVASSCALTPHSLTTIMLAPGRNCL